MDKTLEEALRLRAMGFAVHWLQAETKKPAGLDWPNAAVMSEAELRSSYKKGFNVGFRAGKWSTVHGKEICVLDIDVRGGPAYQEEAFAAAKSLLGGSFNPHVITGSVVGRHQYLLFPRGSSPSVAATTLRQSDVYVTPEGNICPKGTPDAKPAWALELLSTGKNVVLPPSTLIRNRPINGCTRKS
jgi:hypothetical protein